MYCAPKSKEKKGLLMIQRTTQDFVVTQIHFLLQICSTFYRAVDKGWVPGFITLATMTLIPTCQFIQCRKHGRKNKQKEVPSCSIFCLLITYTCTQWLEILVTAHFLSKNNLWDIIFVYYFCSTTFSGHQGSIIIIKLPLLGIWQTIFAGVRKHFECKKINK